MDFLLDTHTVIWFLNGDEQLSKGALLNIEDVSKHKYVSIASLWEIAIKIGLGKLEFDGNTKEVSNLVDYNGFEILPLSINHVIEYEKLEFIHPDPFDRLLVCQGKKVELRLEICYYVFLALLGKRSGCSMISSVRSTSISGQ